MIPQALSWEVETADGHTVRWDAADPDPARRPQEASFDTAAGDGFADGQVRLARSTLRDWPDLNLLDTVRAIGADGRIAYEGRLAGTPRVIDSSEGEYFEVQTTSWMTHAQGRPFTEIWVDRDLTQWADPPLERRRHASTVPESLNSGDFQISNDGQLTIELTTGKLILGAAVAEAWYSAPPGLRFSRVEYLGDASGMAGVDEKLLVSDAPDGAVNTSIALVLDSAPHGVDFNGRYAWIRVTPQAGGVNKSTAARMSLDALAVFGEHGLSRYDVAGDCSALRVTDIGRSIVERFCPKLDASGIADDGTLLSHRCDREPITPYDALQELNSYLGWLLGVWEDRRLVWAPAELGDYDWQVRAGEAGVSISLQGDTIDSFANGVAVSYTDLRGGPQLLLPSDFGELRDDEPNNPANRQGEEQWSLLAIDFPCRQRDALAIGRAQLAELNRPKAPGTITVAGSIRDRNGTSWPVWRPRAGETVAIANSPNDAPRLITQTSFSDDEPQTVTLTLEQPSSRLDVLMARVIAARAAHGLG